MTEQSDKWENQWKQMLTHCHGEEVRADEGFKSGLLADLKRKTAENRAAAVESEAEPVSPSDDGNWSKLLTHAYVPCNPRPFFKDILLSEMIARQADRLPAPETVEDSEEDIQKMLRLHKPVTARREFQTRLLGNLKERQRITAIQRKATRRRTIFMSAMSGMAAAAAVLFVVWVMPMATQTNRSPAAGSHQAAEIASLPAPSAESEQSANVLASASLPETLVPAVGAGLALASLGDYRVGEVFNRSPLPSSMRGIGMQIDRGDGWQDMDETLISNVLPGLAMRPKAGASTSGLGFGDGSTVHMRADAVLETTPQGIAVRQGTMTVNVPANADSRFYLHFDERDVAVEPGTMMAVTVASPDDYAVGGAPAPVVKVLDGGMAVARGKSGAGILLANQVYRLDKYVTADLPGRPLCSVECEELEKSFMQPDVPGMNAYSPAQLVSSGRFEDAAYPAAPAGYAKKGARWQSNSYSGQPTIRIGYLSDEYFALANARRDLSVPLSLGSEVVFDGGDGNFYEIYK